VLKFAGVDSISDAEKLVGCEIQVPRDQRARLGPGSAYVTDLIGCSVLVGLQQDARPIGTVADVQFGAGEAPLLIIRAGAKEYMVPLAQEFLQQLDLAAKRIRMLLPEGMLELDAPLSDEEKQQQAAARKQRRQKGR
jgi:16S rRNA processing protein RimM